MTFWEVGPRGGPETRLGRNHLHPGEQALSPERLRGEPFPVHRGGWHPRLLQGRIRPCGVPRGEPRSRAPCPVPHLGTG